MAAETTQRRDAARWMARGCQSARHSDLPAAQHCFEMALSLAPDDSDAWHNLGTTLKQRGDAPAALHAFRSALIVSPGRADTYFNLGNLLLDAGQFADAAECYERAAKREPALGVARSKLGHKLLEAGHVARAEPLFRQSLGLDPAHGPSWIGLGKALEDGGDATQAIECYLQVLERSNARGEQSERHAFVLGQYLSLVRAPSDLRWVDYARALLKRLDLADEPRALIAYGLAKFFDRRNETADAASAALQANAARRRIAGSLDRHALSAKIDGIINQYDEAFFFARRNRGVATDQPVFIVGMPRSGTTLCEQIISSHSDCHGAGELPDLSALAFEISPEAWHSAACLDVMESRRIAVRYLRALRNGARRNRLRITDKSPFNFFHLAFVALLFPQARVIHCTRQAPDIALSIWLENFNLEQRYATDFDDLAFFIAESRRLMAHWKQALPLKMLEVSYEDTVTDLEGQARGMLDFLGLPWDDNCLHFHRNERVVQTPSRWQVREPIYSSSVGRWKRYAPYVPQLAAAFDDDLGYTLRAVAAR